MIYSGDEQNVFFSDQDSAKKFTEFSAKLEKQKNQGQKCH